ncbi:hypothetical protein OH76DRAFT_1413361 [Lentinus brumalis]|uniref:Uncharacterized protein n=1 Tax=Lentinus brumalis TaxID=2498619 RepID=A0A371CHL7_9APHY|nr:hypothetical protein OH76DRAFT_1413361 [Polyporus brumalis]
MSVRQVLLGHLSRKSAFSAAGTLAASILATPSLLRAPATRYAVCRPGLVPPVDANRLSHATNTAHSSQARLSRFARPVAMTYMRGPIRRITDAALYLLGLRACCKTERTATW